MYFINRIGQNVIFRNNCNKSFYSTKNILYNSNVRLNRNKSLLMYTASILMFGLGLTYAAVPLYRKFCQTTGFGGTPIILNNNNDNTDRLIPDKSSRRLKIKFNSDTSMSLPWSFHPQQRELKVLPGESALAFYTAENKTSQDIIGIATYNVTPAKVAQYFNKIQCFCFEEQKLEANEKVDMPVFFFIDPEFSSDPLMNDVDTITLSYTFFKISDEGGGIPRSSIPLVWTYMYTTAQAKALDPDFNQKEFRAPMAGYGYGLPISRLYARYFGGDLKLISMEGFGTDVYLHLNRLSNSDEPLQ
ncbi:2012_t:CDS:2 [Entrophospora sp. SA101]|nr:2012_t:CDS:2 [Entrophospora sp. SA101]